MQELSLRKWCPEEGHRKGGRLSVKKRIAQSQASQQSLGVPSALCKWHLEGGSGAVTPEWQRGQSFLMSLAAGTESRSWREWSKNPGYFLPPGFPAMGISEDYTAHGPVVFNWPTWLCLLCLVDYSRSMQTGSQSEGHSQEQIMSQTLLTMLTATQE